MDEIIILALDINKDNLNFSEYDRLSPREKIDKIAQYLENACEVLAKEKPKAMWIAGWREHGIAKVNGQAISVEDKNYLHEKMKMFAAKYPNLIILAGTVIVERPLKEVETKLTAKVRDKFHIEKKTELTTDELTKKTAEYQIALEQLNKIITYYAKFPFYQKIKQFREPLLDILQLRNDIKKYLEDLHATKPSAAADPDLTHVTVSSNTLYMYSNASNIFSSNEKKASNDKISIITHRKPMPHNETAGKLKLYRPSSSRSYNPTIQIVHPMSKNVYPFGVQVCKEYAVSAKTYNAAATKPLILFVVSNHVPIQLNDKIASGNFIVHLDSKHKPRLITTEKNLSNQPNVALYRMDLLSAPKIEGALKPFYPIEYTLLAAINNKIDEYKDTAPLVEAIWKKFVKDLDDPDRFKKLQAETKQFPVTNPLQKYLSSKFDEQKDEVVLKNLVSTWRFQLTQELDLLHYLKNDYIKQEHSDVPFKHLNDMLKMDVLDPNISSYLRVFFREMLKTMSVYEQAPNAQYLNSVSDAPLQSDNLSQNQSRLFSNKTEPADQKSLTSQSRETRKQP